MRYLIHAAALLVGLLLPGHPVTAAAQEFVLGDVEDVGLVDDFTPESRPLWEITAGKNVLSRMMHGHIIPGVNNSLLKLQTWRKDPADKEPGHNWYTIGRAVKPDEAWRRAEGIRVALASAASGARWLSVKLTCDDGSGYSQVYQPNLLAMQFAELVLPFENFKDGKGGRLDPGRVTSLSITGTSSTSEESPMYFDRIALYKREKYHSWIDFRTSAEASNLFERGQAVAATFLLGGKEPEGARGFRYEIRDYAGAIVRSEQVPLTPGTRTYAKAFEALRPGYYEVRACWTDAAGKRISDVSCIRGEGSMPTGISTFAVMPSTLAENVERFKALGANAYLGMHGDTAGLADAVGLTWRLEYRKWNWLEREKPDRSAGRAPWAADLIAKEAPFPAHRPHILNMRINLFTPEDAPKWAAKESPDRAPFFKEWDYFLDHFRDYIAVEKHLYPHMKPRIYDVLWEVNLNMPPAGIQKPPYTFADVVEACRRAREVVRAEDPDGILIGPNHSALFEGGDESLAWHEELFKAGLLKHVDALSCHGYHRPAPEDRDMPGTMRRLNDLVKQYNGGKPLPLYCTEMGYTDSVGSTRDTRRQAEMMVRFAIIFRGEGGKVFFPFYGSDYGRGHEYGFLFNLEMETKRWGAKRFAPKPVAPAMGALVRLIEGATPVRRVEGLGEGVWAYLFDRKGTRFLAVWHPYEKQRVRIPVRSAKGVEVLDFMGYPVKAPVANGALEVEVGPAPVYVQGM